MNVTSLQTKKNNVYLILAAVFITNALLAEIIGVKIFSLEKVFTITPSSAELLGVPINFNLTVGVLLWPIVFLTTDVLNEYFGPKGVKKISYITAGLIAYSFFVFVIAKELPPADFWVDVNFKSLDSNDNPFDANYAFSNLFGQGTWIIIASLTAFLIGQLSDAYIFDSIKKVTGNKMIWLRATGSTLVSQLIDSFVVILIIGISQNWPAKYIIAVSLINYIYKFVVAVVLTPVIYFVHKRIDTYLAT